MHELYTIGHSNHSTGAFIQLLDKHSITAVCDVRSQPYSKYNPQFNRETIQKDLKKAGIAYVFLGSELGPRSDDPDFYVDGKISYRLLAEGASFQQGLDRLKTGMKSFRIAIMCAEKDPLMCHRTILVCRHLRKEVDIQHVLEDGSLENHKDSEKRLLRLLNIPELQLFETVEELIQRAFDIQGEKMAYIVSDRSENQDAQQERIK